MASLEIVQFSDQWFSTRASMARWFPSHGDETGDELGGFNPSQKICSAFESIIPFCNPLSCNEIHHRLTFSGDEGYLDELFLLVQVSFYRNQDLVYFEPCQRPEAVRKCPALPWRSTLRVGMESMEFSKPWWIVTIFQSGTWGCNGYNNVWICIIYIT